MYKYFIVILSVTSFFAHSAQADFLEPKKQELIDYLLEVNQVSSIVQQMKNSLTKQILLSFADENGEVDRGLAIMVEQEAAKVLYENLILNNKLNEIHYDLYSEFFTVGQLSGIVAFYKSPTGKQFKKYMPEISKRSVIDYQIVAQESVQIVQQRIANNLAKFRLEMEQAEAEKTTN